MTKAFLLISLAFIILERLIPWRKEQPMLRKGFLTDLIFIAFNGYLFSKLFYFSLAATVLVYFSHAMETLGAWDTLNSAVMRGHPVWVQFLTLFLIQDFMKWVCTTYFIAFRSCGNSTKSTIAWKSWIGWETSGTTGWK